MESGSSWREIPSSVRKDFAQEEKVERHWMALQSQLLHDLERGVPEAAESGWTFDYSRVAAYRTSGDGSVAGDAVKTECDERVAQRCGEPARLAPVQKHERELGMFVRLHNKIPGMRIGVENGFGKSGKQRIDDRHWKTTANTGKSVRKGPSIRLSCRSQIPYPGRAPESESESVRFRGRRVTKVAPEVKRCRWRGLPLSRASL